MSKGDLEAATPKCCDAPEPGFTEFPEWDGTGWEVTLECLACGADTKVGRLVLV